MQTVCSGKNGTQNYESAFLPFLLLLSFSIASFWFWSSYFETSPATGLSWYGQDGHCEPSEALGNHCFGDIAALDYQNPQSPEAVYPRTSRAFTYPLILAYNRVGSHLSILLLMGGSLALLISSLLCLLARQSSKVGFVILVIFLTSNVGFLAMVDRGNVAGLAVGFLSLALALGRPSKSPSMFQKCIIVASSIAALSIKPTYIFFIILLPLHLQFAVVVGTCSAYLVAYTPITGGNLSALATWLQTALDWASSSPQDANFPPNYSFQGTVLLLPALIAIAFLSLSALRALRANYREFGFSINPTNHRALILLSLVSYLTVNSIVYAYNLMLIAMISVLWAVETMQLSDRPRNTKRFDYVVIAFLSVPLAPIFLGDLRPENFTLTQTNWNVAVTLSAVLASVATLLLSGTNAYLRTDDSALSDIE